MDGAVSGQRGQPVCAGRWVGVVERGRISSKTHASKDAPEGCQRDGLRDLIELRVFTVVEYREAIEARAASIALS